MWELAASKANISLEDKVSMLTDEILELKERVKELGIQEIKDYYGNKGNNKKQ
jgi:hypothetical protein